MMKYKLRILVVLVFGIFLYICSVKYGAQLLITKSMHMFLPYEMQCTGKEITEIIKLFYDSNFSDVIICANREKVLVENPVLKNSVEIDRICYKGALRVLSTECNTIDYKDKKGCYIDIKTAHRLFGSEKVEGECIEINGIEYVVRQVISSPLDTIFIQIADEDIVDVQEIILIKSSSNLNEEIEQILSVRYGIAGTSINLELILWVSNGLLLVVPILGFIILFRNYKKYSAKSKNMKCTILNNCILILILLIAVGYIMIQVYFPVGIPIHKISEFELWGENFNEIREDIYTLLYIERNIILTNLFSAFLKSLLFEMIAIICLGRSVFYGRAYYSAFFEKGREVYEDKNENQQVV